MLQGEWAASQRPSTEQAEPLSAVAELEVVPPLHKKVRALVPVVSTRLSAAFWVHDQICAMSSLFIHFSRLSLPTFVGPQSRLVRNRERGVEARHVGAIDAVA